MSIKFGNTALSWYWRNLKTPHARNLYLAASPWSNSSLPQICDLYKTPTDTGSVVCSKTSNELLSAPTAGSTSGSIFESDSGDKWSYLTTDTAVPESRRKLVALLSQVHPPLGEAAFSLCYLRGVLYPLICQCSPYCLKPRPLFPPFLIDFQWL